MPDVYGNGSSPAVGTATPKAEADPELSGERLGVGSERIGPDAIDPERISRRSRRNKKLIILVFLLVVCGGGAGLGIYLLVKRANFDVWIGRGRGQTDERRLAEGLQQQAIKEVSEAAGPVVQPTPQIIVMEPARDATAELNQLVTEPSPETGRARDERTVTPKDSSVKEPAPIPLKRQDDASIWMTAQMQSGRLPASSRPYAAVTPLTKEAPKTAAATPPQPPLPPFGQMLPVRSLGVVYTLRTGSLARFELTRDVEGSGWSLRRGTVFVGTLRGSEYDRAYLSMIGYLDPATGRLVKVSGDVLGADGSDGLKGTRRHLASGWSRLLRPAAEIGTDLLQTLLARGSRGTTVIISGGRNAAQAEMNGLAARNTNREFVEVPAGAPAYLLITRLPEEIQGVDALTTLPSDELARRLNPDQPDDSTGLTEAELAALFAEGSPEQVRAAMPRMTAPMRVLAQRFLDQSPR